MMNVSVKSNMGALHLWSLPLLEAWAGSQCLLQMPGLLAHQEEGPTL